MTHLLIVLSPYYPAISAALLQGASEALAEHGASHDIVQVPGAFEIPAAIALARRDERYDGFIALGCVIRGETTHYDHICEESARGLMALAVDYQTIIGNGILTVENEQQALVRADIRQGNKGRDAALAALCLIALKRQFDASA